MSAAMEEMDRIEVQHTPNPTPVDLASQPQAAAVPAGDASGQPWYARLTLASMLERFSRSPRSNALLGVCEDGFPMLFDFTDPRPGPLAVLGDAHSGKTGLLRLVVHSAVRYNPSSQVQVAVISNHPEEFAEFSGQGAYRRYSLGVFDSEDPAAGQALMDVAAAAEEQYRQKKNDLIQLLVLDGLGFVPYAAGDVQLNLEWLLKFGPALRVWPIAALHTYAALKLGRWLRHFHTRLIGHMPPEPAARLALQSGLDSQDLLSGRQFAVHTGERWMKLWLPLIEDSRRME
ncbi:MAG: hypothetical protein VB089_21695 [Anaerolineaceae bacterium]|nr:hypothetical protein [Anaerolineaceae bacterium]